MRTVTFAVVSLILAACARAAELRPTGANCALESPPPTSGEEALRGHKLLIFPRAKDIDSTYSGCQGLWAPQGNSWALGSLMYIENGQVVRVWAGANPNDPILACRFRDGKLVAGDAAVCPSLQLLPHKSLASGCFDKVRASGSFPPECQYG
jgi:hypothetical protein